MKKKVLVVLVLLTITGTMVFAQQAKTYYIEIWDISSATYDRMGSIPAGTLGALEDNYFLVRSTSGSKLRSKDGGQSIEQLRQKLHNIDTASDAPWRMNGTDQAAIIQRLQERGLVTARVYRSGGTGRYSGTDYYVYAWIRVEN